MTGPIPVLIVINGLNCGGAEQHLLQVLPRLDSRRFKVRIHPLQPGGRLADEFASRGVSFVAAQESGKAWIDLWKLGATIYQERPIVHCFLPKAYLFGGFTALVFRARCLVMSRRSRNHYQSRRPIAAWIERCLYRYTDAMLGNSRVVMQDLLDEGAPPERARLIYSGLDCNRFAAGDERSARRQAMRSALGLSDDRIALICVANLFSYKGHADLLNALGLLRNRLTSNVDLLLVGRDAGERAALEAQAARLGLSASVRFLGERGDVPDLLAASDIGVLASHEEGFSNAVLEGMAAGLPMVVSDVGGNAEAVTGGECGHVVPARAPDALALALADLIGDAGRRQTMGEASRLRVAASFSLDACVAAYESLYEELWDRHIEAASRK
ncbi:glycosyltransferase [Synechococcus sp. JJ3a-Johnson]|uniref:glycosyltransferase n=1 Tax=Synechococcus sp. JJ3a-Johnson TaxID=2823738 RepID=UPI0020CF0FFE|nr:glycosyltransferase [Synechococcus sp. JJ3a-Johnson]MCP9830097.1 glycosyltransferase [Synechococcus sp. JJ3a-Johnson]